MQRPLTVARERGARRACAIRCVPATPARWPDLERLFGDRGACAGCWCMWARLTSSEFSRGRGARNKGALRRLVESGARPGLIAYRGRTPVGWCALAPRREYARLERSKVMAPVDHRPVWSVVCFFVDRAARGSGATTALLRAAVRDAGRPGPDRARTTPAPRGGPVAERRARG